MNVVIVIGVLCAIMIPSSFIYKRFYNVSNPNALHQEFNDSQDPDYKDQESRGGKSGEGSSTHYYND